MPSGFVPGQDPVVLTLALLIAAVSSGVLLLFGPGGRPRPVAWLFGLLDIVLITAIVAATGGGRSIFAFLYVLSVTGACMLLSRTGGLAMACRCPRSRQRSRPARARPHGTRRCSAGQTAPRSPCG